MPALKQQQAALNEQYQQLKNKGLELDLTRGKPSSSQLDLSNALDGILAGDYTYHGVDVRNYGGIEGLSELRELFAQVLQCPSEQVITGGNSSLSLMHQTLFFAAFLGLFEDQKPWLKQGTPIKMLCPVPGYDRHFKVCEDLGIEMINIPMLDDGPDMDKVESLVKQDSSIKGMWNVPRFSNPTGITYSSETVERIAKLGLISAPDFIVLWDNAYAVHSFDAQAEELCSISELAMQADCSDHIVEFASTSKVTFAGAGVAALATGSNTFARIKAYLSSSTIGPDKVNQLRHLKLLSNFAQLKQHMQAHAEFLKPRFDAVLSALESQLDDSYGTWTQPKGGYFVSFNTHKGLAQQVVELCAQAGVKMTPAGATFPYGKDPDDSNIRIAPSFAELDDIETAMQVFCTSVKLAQINAQLKQA